VAASSWAGVALGFAAVLMVARPGLGALSLYTVFPATAAVFYALFQLQSRHLGAAGERPLTTLAWTLSVGTLAMLPVALAQWVPPTPEGWLLLAALGATFGGGQYYLAKAFALAPANVLTPFSYVQIVSAALFGLVVFHDVPDFWTIAGAVLILGAGAYVFSRGRR
jgi:drug/metabolite transporter (DMT)-like permease